MEIRIVDSLGNIEPSGWNSLSEGIPHLSHAYLHALEESGCVSGDSGWIPLFPTLWREGELKGAMPLYLKLHSWGEYVFDWAWADAYRRHGIPYYPKLVSSIPFTPISGPRILAENRQDRQILLEAALDLASGTRASGLHCLFPDEAEAKEMEQKGMMLRRSIQFHWENRGYEDFDAFLATMDRDKRKKIRQERRKVKDAGISFERKRGREISEAEWAFFESCYRNTYLEHHSTPYLNLDFFLRIGKSIPDNLLLVLAKREGKMIASALNLLDDARLYGRYWGAIEQHPGLHFEACYYQGIEYCIERGLEVFEGGAQGTHKIARGFMPVQTFSAHRLFHEGFSNAVGEFLERESAAMEEQMGELSESGPFSRS